MNESSYPEEVVRANAADRVRLLKRAQDAEDMLAKAQGMLTNTAEARAKLEVELEHHRQCAPVVFDLIDALAAMSERPGVQTVRQVRSLAARVRIAFDSKGIGR